MLHGSKAVSSTIEKAIAALEAGAAATSWAPGRRCRQTSARASPLRNERTPGSRLVRVTVRVIRVRVRIWG